MRNPIFQLALITFALSLAISPEVNAEDLQFEPAQISIIPVGKLDVGLSIDGVSTFYQVPKKEVLRVHLALASAISLQVPIEVNMANKTLRVGRGGPTDSWFIDARYIRHLPTKDGIIYFFSKAGFPPLKLAQFRKGTPSAFANYVATAHVNPGFIEVNWDESCYAQWHRLDKHGCTWSLSGSPKTDLVLFDSLAFLRPGSDESLVGSNYANKPMHVKPQLGQYKFILELLKMSPNDDVMCLRSRMTLSYLVGDEKNGIKGTPSGPYVDSCRLIRRDIFAQPVLLGFLPNEESLPMATQARPNDIYLAPPPSAPPPPDTRDKLDTYHYTERDVRLILLRTYGMDPKDVSPGDPIRTKDTLIFPAMNAHDDLGAALLDLVRKYYASTYDTQTMFIPVKFGSRWVAFHISYISKGGNPHIQVLALAADHVHKDFGIKKVFELVHARYAGGKTWSCATSIVYGAAHSEPASSGAFMIENLTNRDFSDVGRRVLNNEAVHAVREKHMQLLAKYGETLDGSQAATPAAHVANVIAGGFLKRLFGPKRN
jgi:hypothetical protein